MLEDPRAHARTLSSRWLAASPRLQPARYRSGHCRAALAKAEGRRHEGKQRWSRPLNRGRRRLPNRPMRSRRNRNARSKENVEAARGRRKGGANRPGRCSSRRRETSPAQKRLEEARGFEDAWQPSRPTPAAGPGQVPQPAAVTAPVKIVRRSVYPLAAQRQNIQVSSRRSSSGRGRTGENRGSFQSGTALSEAVRDALPVALPADGRQGEPVPAHAP
jgi:hypothetical protein